MKEQEIRPGHRLNLSIKELIEYKELFFFFTWRDIKIKYKQTALGFFWAIIQPVLMMIVFTVFFGKMLSVPSDGIPYPIFVFSGLMLWNVFSSGLTNSGNSMVTNANIIKKIYFPRIIIPLSAILVSLFDFIMTFMAFIGLLIFYNYKIDLLKILIYLPVSIIITIIATLGPGTLLSALNVKYRDFRYIIPFLIQFLLFVTPVIYPLSMIKEEWMKYALALNPMAAAINIGRAALTQLPLDYVTIGISFSSGILLLIIGFIVFKKTEAYFADLA
jgi:lipopolysaccharide transport system permease protein